MRAAAALVVLALVACTDGTTPGGEDSGGPDLTDVPEDVADGAGEVGDADAEGDGDGEVDAAEDVSDADGSGDGEDADADLDAEADAIMEVEGDRCEDAIVVSGEALPFTYQGDSTFADDDYSLNGGCGTGGSIGKGAPEVVFAFTPAVTGWHVMGLSPATLVGDSPSAAYVTTDCAAVADSCVKASGDLTAGGVFSSYLDAGVTYFVIVDGLTAADAGGFTFFIDEAVCVPQCAGDQCGKDGCGGECGPGCAETTVCDPSGVCKDPFEVPANSCPSAVKMESLPFGTSADTYYGSNDYQTEPDACAGEVNPVGGGSNDHIYWFDPPVTGIYRITVFSDFDAAIYVSTSCQSPGGAFCVGAADATLEVEELDVALEAGTPAFVIVDGASNDLNSNGAYQLFVNEACVPDCSGKECGNDGCGGSCGACSTGQVCAASGQCKKGPVGDTCLGPFEVDTLPFSAAGDTSNFTPDYGYGAGDCPGIDKPWGAASSDVVYALTPEQTDQFVISLQADFDSTLYVVSDCAAIESSCVAGQDLSPSGETLTVVLDGGTTYYVIVDGYGNIANAKGEYTLTIEESCSPECGGKVCGADGCGGVCGECAGTEKCTPEGQCEEVLGNSCTLPFVVDAVPFSASGDTSDAYSEYGVPYDACPPETAVRGVTAKDEVYAFTPDVSAVYTIEVTANYAGTLYVIDDCSNYAVDCFEVQDPGQLQWYTIKPGCSDAADYCHGHDTRFEPTLSKPKVSAWLEAGTTYFVIVDGEANVAKKGGTYTLTISEPCSPQCDGLECGDDGCGLTCGECQLGLVCGDTQLCEELEGNACFTPFVVDTVPFVTAGDTSDATNTYGTRKGHCEGLNYSSGAGSMDEVYAFTAPADGTYTASLDAQFDGALYVLTSCDDFLSSCYYKETLGYNSWIATSPLCTVFDKCVAGSWEELGDEGVEFEMLAGETLYVVVDGKGSLYDESGAYTLTIDEKCEPQCDGKQCGDDGCGGQCGECPGGFVCTDEFICVDTVNAQGNTCDNPWVVGALPFIASGDTSVMSAVYGGSCGGDGARDEVWAFTPTETGLYVVTVTDDAPFDAVIYVLQDCVGAEGTCIASAYEAIDVTLEAGTTYHVVVDGWKPVDEGTYVLEIKKP